MRRCNHKVVCILQMNFVKNQQKFPIIFQDELMHSHEHEQWIKLQAAPRSI